MSGARPEYIEVPLRMMPSLKSSISMPKAGGETVPEPKGKRGSCSECRQRRIKCCRQRPCLNCVSRKRTCSEKDDEQMVQVKAAKPGYPIAFVGCLQCTAERVDQIAAAAVEVNLSPVLVVRIAEAGYQIQPILDILLRLPPSVKDVLGEWLPVLEKIFAKLSANSNRLGTLMSKMPRPAPDVLDTHDDVNTGLSIDVIEDLVKCDAWSSITYDLVKGGRKFIKMGAGLSDFFNCHTEEMLARVAANELPLSCTEVETFCTIMYLMVGPAKPTSFHENGAPSGMETTLVSRHNNAFLRGGSSSNPETMIAKQRFIRVLDKCGRMTVLCLSYVCFLVFLSSCLRVHAARACTNLFICLWLVRCFIDAILGHGLGPGVSTLLRCFVAVYVAGLFFYSLWSFLRHCEAKKGGGRHRRVTDITPPQEMIIAWYRMPEDEFKATVQLDGLRRASASNSSAGSSVASSPPSPPQGAERLGGGGGLPAGAPAAAAATPPLPPAASRARRPMLERPFAHALLDHRGYTELNNDHASDTRLRERYS
jgi:hypothetical protein